MSIPVPLEQLVTVLDEYGSAAYLLTTGADGRPRAVSVLVRLAGGELVMAAGTRTIGNARAEPLVGLLWPPPEPGAHTLIVDGEARVTGAAEVVVRPTWAVLHRPADHRAGAEGGGASGPTPT